MKRLVLTVTVLSLIATAIPFRGTASGPFETKLSKEQQIVQALNRLTFGPRPGDLDEVRRMGVEKWIELQLQPARVPENPALEAKLKPLETLRMDAAQVLKDYAPVPPIQIRRPVNLNTLLPPEELRKVMNGTAEERTAVLRTMDVEKRKQILTMVPPNVLASTPEFPKEADAARREQQEEVQKEIRRRNPPLMDLLTPDQMNTAMRGNPEQVAALFEFLDPVKRQQVAAALPPQTLANLPEMRRQGMRTRQPLNVVSGDLKEGKVFRALYSNRQLEEVLVDFWFNHFNVYEAKTVQALNNPVRMVLASFERDAIRPHVLGHFKDLLLATARHPAMLYYLDNWQSMAPGSFEVGPFATGPNVNLPSPLARQTRGLNENYGREVMELHTLGVGGGYTQDDVLNVARAFTGWTVRQPASNPEFVFASFMHDFGAKTVLGQKIPAGGGEQDGLLVVDILARHPSTAKYISRRLAQRFVSDEPPQALVDRMAKTFTKTSGDLREVLETMFTSQEFFSEGAWQAKIKSPLELVVSAVRAAGGEVTDTFALAQRIADLGAPLYGKLDPNGYPNTGEAWLNTASLMGRMNFATVLVSGQIPGVKVDGTRWEGRDAGAIARDLLGREVPPQTLETIEKGLQGKGPTPRLLASLVMSMPDFQRR